MFVEIAKVGKQERPTVTSLDVAETFGKLHQHVLRDIRELGCSEEFRLSNFGQSSYENAQGHKQPMFIITRDGFTLLAMGYTGELAMKFKEAYIKQFNAMEAALQGKLIEREKGIAVRQALTKALQQSNYTNCIYRALFGKDAAQLRRDYGLGAKDNLRDAFPQEELAAVQSMERLVSGLVDCGWEYAQIKEFIGKTNSRLAISA